MAAMRSAHPGKDGFRRRRRPGPDRAAATPVPEWDLQTTFSVARLEDDPACPTGRLLFLDGIECSYVDLRDPTHLEFGYVRRMADVVDLVRPGRMPIDAVHMGGGGVTLPRYVAATRPRSRQVVYEKDAGLVEIARRYLGLRTSPALRVRIGDARERLRDRPDASADLVVGDAFDGVVVPPHLATVEFAAEVRRVLRPAGMYVLNVIDGPPLRASRAAAATLLAAFDAVALVTAHDVLRERDAGNVVFVASGAPLPLASLSRAAARGALPDLVLDRAEVTAFAGTARPVYDCDGERWLAAAPAPDLPVPIPPRHSESDTPHRTDEAGSS
jgi:spermidine synthase